MQRRSQFPSAVRSGRWRAYGLQEPWAAEDPRRRSIVHVDLFVFLILRAVLAAGWLVREWGNG